MGLDYFILSMHDFFLILALKIHEKFLMTVMNWKILLKIEGNLKGGKKTQELKSTMEKSKSWRGKAPEFCS